MFPCGRRCPGKAGEPGGWGGKGGGGSRQAPLRGGGLGERVGEGGPSAGVPQGGSWPLVQSHLLGAAPPAGSAPEREGGAARGRQRGRVWSRDARGDGGSDPPSFPGEQVPRDAGAAGRYRAPGRSTAARPRRRRGDKLREWGTGRTFPPPPRVMKGGLGCQRAAPAPRLPPARSPANPFPGKNLISLRLGAGLPHPLPLTGISIGTGSGPEVFNLLLRKSCCCLPPAVYRGAPGGRVTGSRAGGGGAAPLAAVCSPWGAESGGLGRDGSDREGVGRMGRRQNGSRWGSRGSARGVVVGFPSGGEGCWEPQRSRGAGCVPRSLCAR